MANLVQKTQIVSGFVPVDLQTAQSGDWVSMKNHNHLTVVFFKGAGTAGDDPTITMAQATVVAGTDTKALTFTDIWYKQNTVLTAESTFTHTTQTAAATYTDTTSAEDCAIWVLEFDAEDLDAVNNFDCVQASIGDVGSNAQLGCILYILSEPRYASDGSLEAIAD